MHPSWVRRAVDRCGRCHDYQGQTAMRFVWAWGAWTAWLVVPFGTLLMNRPAGDPIDNEAYALDRWGIMIGCSGVLAIYWALSVLIFRLLKAGDPPKPPKAISGKRSRRVQLADEAAPVADA